MYKIYFKQAIEMLKQNKFISIIAILGTALAIMMIMAIIVSDEIRNISVSPETNRDRTLYIYRQMTRDTVRGGMMSSAVRLDILQKYLSQLKTPELISAVDFNIYALPSLVNKQGDDNKINAIVRKTDASYWILYSYSFLEGKPFGQAAFESGTKEAVISATTAQTLFKGEQVLGEFIEIDQIPYRIVGVVKDVSPVFKLAYGEVWISYTSQKKFEGDQYMFNVMLLARHKDDFPDIMEEVRKAEKKYDSEHERVLTLRGPETHRSYSMDLWGNTNDELKENTKIENRKMAFILLILLLVPAINLSGLSFSRMKKRTAEIGVRKAFGAKKHVILIQILLENLITSLLGGIIGLFFSYLVVFQMRQWLLGIPADSPIPIGTLVSFPVFLAVFIVCILVNLLSAGFPAYRVSKTAIVNSLNQNDK